MNIKHVKIKWVIYLCTELASYVLLSENLIIHVAEVFMGDLTSLEIYLYSQTLGQHSIYMYEFIVHAAEVSMSVVSPAVGLWNFCTTIWELCSLRNIHGGKAKVIQNAGHVLYLFKIREKDKQTSQKCKVKKQEIMPKEKNKSPLKKKKKV